MKSVETVGILACRSPAIKGLKIRMGLGMPGIPERV